MGWERIEGNWAHWKGLVKHPWGTPNRLLYWGPAVQPAAGAASSFPWWRSTPMCLKPSPGP